MTHEAEVTEPKTGTNTNTDVEAAPGAPPDRPRRGLPQFRREERQELRYRLSLLLAWLISWVAWLIPRRVRYWLADRGGDAYFAFFKTYRANVADNLRHVLGASAGEDVMAATSRTIFRFSARNFMDLLTMAHVDRQTMVESVPLVRGEWAFLNDAVARGKGVVLITAHLGCFDYVGQALHSRGYKITTVTGRTTARFMFDGVTYLRRSLGMAIVEATPSGVRRVVQALRRGECAAFLTDRDFFQNGKPVTFFGRPTTLPPGAVRIARDTGAAIVAVFAQRTDTGYGLALEPPFVVPKTADLDADVANGLERIVAILERAIAAAPEQWVMFQRVWPSAPADPVRVFPVGSPLETDLLERVGAALPPWRPRADASDPPPPDPAAAPTDRTDSPPRSPAP